MALAEREELFQRAGPTRPNKERKNYRKKSLDRREKTGKWRFQYSVEKKKEIKLDRCGKNSSRADEAPGTPPSKPKILNRKTKFRNTTPISKGGHNRRKRNGVLATLKSQSSRHIPGGRPTQKASRRSLKRIGKRPA